MSTSHRRRWEPSDTYRPYLDTGGRYGWSFLTVNGVGRQGRPVRHPSIRTGHRLKMRKNIYLFIYLFICLFLWLRESSQCWLQIFVIAFLWWTGTLTKPTVFEAETKKVRPRPRPKNMWGRDHYEWGRCQRYIQVKSRVCKHRSHQSKNVYIFQIK